MTTGTTVGILVVLGVIAAVLKFLLPLLKKPSKFPYESAGVLLSPAERSFMGVLEQAVGSDYRILVKVRLADVLSVKKGLSRADWQMAFNRIQSKHLDFVLCQPNDYSIVCAVELDDSSHAEPKRQDRDNFVDEALKAAGVPLFRFSVKMNYSIQEIQKTLTEEAAPAEPPATNEPACPNCGGKMVKRVAKSGANTGKVFWGCSTFPKCKGIVEIG